jgi:hypothetical protein
MKLRKGFVSNSSSSSFIIYGINLDEHELSDDFYIKLFDDWYSKLSPEYSYDRRMLSECKLFSSEEKVDFVKDDLSSVFDGRNFDTGGNNDYVSGYYIGLSPTRLISRYPDTLAKNLLSAMVDNINKEFGTSFVEGDVEYVEEILV